MQLRYSRVSLGSPLMWVSTGLEATERIIDDLDCTPEQKLKGAVKYVGVNYVDTCRREFLSLTQGDRSVAKYEAEFMRLSSYARGMVATEYERCVRFKDGLKDNLKVLIAPKREQHFVAMIDKVKIAEEVKHVERQNRERGRNKRESEPSNSVQMLKKKARVDRPIKFGVPIAATGQPPCTDCGRLHQGECWKKTGAYLRCCSLEHRIRNCPRRGSNGLGCGQRALDRGVGQAEARQPALFYATYCREEVDTPDVITGTFLVYDVPYTALIDIGSTHSYIVCTVSENLGTLAESTTSEVTVLSPLGQSVRVNRMFRDVPLEVQGTIFLFDLMELPFGEFDVILGID
ncbi:uncharacterized protein LOC108481539 [Gossypium arboreum]|uniref:uncharacterized protein LOC108481539 n=1 Tax=Gossypium arboreum TaxID=29729 RepID=UPI00081903CB|nr:uncharacterized protein LOC108481539 [Gossypium arboreum]